MSDSILKDHNLLAQMKELIPDRADKWPDLKSALSDASEKIMTLPEGALKEKLLDIALEVGQDSRYTDYGITAQSFKVVINSGSTLEISLLLNHTGMIERLSKHLQFTEDEQSKIDLLNALKQIVTDDAICLVIAKSPLLDSLLEIGESANVGEELQKNTQEVLLALAMSEKTKDINKLQSKYAKQMNRQGLKEIVMARRYGKAWRGKLLANLLKQRKQQREQEEKEKRQNEKEEEEERRQEEEVRRRKEESTEDVTPKHIMISYSRKDYDFAAALDKVLKNAGLPTWINPQDDSTDVLEMLADAVENASCLLIVVSSHYEKDFSCKMEARYAYEMGIPLFPVRVEKDYLVNGWLDSITTGMSFHEFLRPEQITPQKCRVLTLIIKNSLPRDR